eukprot:scaffold91472_cov31-Tisochrysis_lutea.AAC.7
MLEQSLHILERGRRLGCRLDGEPLVDDELLLIGGRTLVKGGERLVARLAHVRRERCRRGERVGHAGGGAELRERALLVLGGAALAQPALAHSGRLDVECLTLLGRQTLVGGEQLRAESGGNGVLGGLECGAERIGIDRRHLLRERRVVWQRKRVGGERWVERLVGQCSAVGLEQRLAYLALAVLSGKAEQHARGKLLRSIPPVEGVRVARGEEERTGAEKPRSNEGTGSEGTLSKTKLCSSSRSCSTRVSPSGVPSLSSRPVATGMTKGSFVGWPGVAGVDCERVRV